MNDKTNFTGSDLANSAQIVGDSDRTLDRRTAIKAAGVVWGAPVILGVAAAPTFAASVRNDPGINGWVQISTTNRETQGTDTYKLRFNSNLPGQFGPDGAPYGLYTRNPTVAGQPPAIIDVIDQAAITLWLRTDQDTTPSKGFSNPGSGWSTPVEGALSNSLGLGDAQQYRAYRSNYSGSFALVGDRAVLNNFDTTVTVNGRDATYWIERTIRINGQVLSFRRRNGDDGALGNGFPGNTLQRKANSVAVGDLTVSA